VTLSVLALDIDGVLTDGGIYLSDRGDEMLRFGVLDGLGITRWLASGRECVWVSARESAAATIRAERLGVRHLLLGVHDKVAAMEAFLSSHGYCWDQVVYVGDDLIDLEPMRRSGLGIAVSNAVPELKRAAGYVTVTAGGSGAVREVIDMLLQHSTGPEDAILKTSEKGAGGHGSATARRRRARTS